MAEEHDGKQALADGGAAAEARGSFLETRSGVLEDAEDASFDGFGGFGGAESQERWAERDSRNALRRVDNLLGEADPAAAQNPASGPAGSQVEYQRVRLERVVLVGVYSAAETTLAAAEESMRELAALAQTAGAVVCDGVLQQREHPDAASYLGSGKARELARLVAAENADTIIADTELPPSQRRALEDIAGVKVVDRTAVILDIFARHATSKEGKAQVELAQLEYMLPRLRGWGAALSRQAGGQAAGQNGGIGSRGPGETRLEMNRRVIHKRMSKLRRDIAAMEPTRRAKRDSRHRNGMPVVSVVGYTNAGKSSLTNAVARSHELVGNALFATLDTAVRGAKTSTGRLFAYADTVGFIRGLPTQLVEAFKSTLEEIADSSLVLHVVDASYEDPGEQIAAVDSVLAGIDGAEAIERLLVFNKIDLLGQEALDKLRDRHPDAVFCSAKTGEGLGELTRAVEVRLPAPPVHVEALLGFDQGGLVEQARTRGVLRSTEYTNDGIKIVADVDDGLAAKLLDASR